MACHVSKYLHVGHMTSPVSTCMHVGHMASHVSPCMQVGRFIKGGGHQFKGREEQKGKEK